MKIAAWALLAVCVILTGMMIRELRDVPGHVTGWGVPNLTSVMMLILVRWVVLTVAFSLLLGSGNLARWAPNGFLRGLLILAGVFAFEIATFNICSDAVNFNIKPQYQQVIMVLVFVYPAAIIAGGFFASRSLFLVGLLAAVSTAIVGSAGADTFLKLKKPFITVTPDTTVYSLLLSANPLYSKDQLKEVFAAIEGMPDWRQQVAVQLDGDRPRWALYALCHDPAQLDENLRERCWASASRGVVEMNAEMDRIGFLTLVETLQLVEPVQALAAIPGPLRDRHHDVFIAVRDLARRVREKESTSQVPDLSQSDWLAPGATP